MHGKGPRLQQLQRAGAVPAAPAAGAEEHRCKVPKQTRILRFEVKPIPKHRIKNLFGALAEGV